MGRLIIHVTPPDPDDAPAELEGDVSVTASAPDKVASLWALDSLHGLWEGIIDIPPPPDPPFDIDTFEPIEPPWQAIREWIPADEGEPSSDLFDQRPDSGKPVEIPREDGTILVLDSD